MLDFGRWIGQGLTHQGIITQYTSPQPKMWSKHCPFIQKYLGYIDKYIFFPFDLKKQVQAFQPDIIHILDHSNAVYARPDWPVVMTCHDLIAVRSACGYYQQNPVGLSGKLLQAWISRCLKKCQAIVFDSQATRRAYEEHFGYLPKQHAVVGIGIDHPLLKASQVEQTLHDIHPALITKPYILHIGSNAWYKNRLGILQTVAHLQSQDMRLVFAGEPCCQRLQAAIHQLGIADRFLDLGDVNETVKQALYQKARCLFFPSIAEGFGLPLLEAMYAGCRAIITPDRALAEIAQDTAVYVPAVPDDPRQLQAWAKQAADVVDSVLNEDEAVRAIELQKARTRAHAFSVDQMITDYIAFYWNVVAK